MTLPLFETLEPRESLAEGALVLRNFVCTQTDDANLLAAVNDIEMHSPFRHMITPGGFRMSVAITNAGSYGWVTDRAGYRYDRIDPHTGKPWPPMPEFLFHLAKSAAEEAGHPAFIPDACLINRYEVGARMSLHQDKNELDFKAPIVSVSLGVDATFLFGGPARADKTRRVTLRHGDVVVWGGASRLFFHGVLPLKAGTHALLGNRRINLTFRKAR